MMKAFICLVLTCAATGAAVVSTSSGQLLPPVSDDVKLQVAKQEFDEDAAARPEAAHVETVAKYFTIDSRVVEALRSANKSWGEITLRLVFAQQAVKAQPDRYGTPAQAMQKIGELRGARASWNEVAAQLDMALPLIIHEAQRVRKELRASFKPTGTDSQGGHEGVPRRRAR